MNKDLTTGSPSSVLWKFCLPLFGSMIFQQLYNICDSVIAGKFVGEKALAAVGNSYEITLIFLALSFGCNIGTSVIVSAYFGAKRYGKMRSAITTSAITSAAVCAVLVIAGSVFCDSMLQIINTNPEIFEDSRIYLSIYIWGLPFVFFYNIATGIFAALGDSRTPFIFLAASSIANIGADILFVKVFSMGVAGVAYATFICQGISCILAVIFVVLRLSKLSSDEHAPLFSRKMLVRFLRIAIPSALQQGFVSIGNIILQGLINTFSTGVVAGYAASIKLNNMVITSYNAVSNGISNYTAQNLGAGKLDRVREGFKAGVKIMLCITIPISLIYFFFGGALMGIFMNSPTADAFSTGTTFLRIVAPFYVIVAVKINADGVLRGSGMTGRYLVGTLIDLIVRVGLSFILASTVLGSVGIWLSWPFGWIVGLILAFTFYRTADFRKSKL